MLVLAVHHIAAISATLPLCCIVLTGMAKKGELPPDFKLRQLIPTSGKAATSLWDVPDVAALQSWLDENLSDDATHSCYAVQEDFTFGLTMELSRARNTEAVSTKTRELGHTAAATADDVATKARQSLVELNEQYHISQKATAAAALAREKTDMATKKASAFLGGLWASASSYADPKAKPAVKKVEESENDQPADNSGSSTTAPPSSLTPPCPPPPQNPAAAPPSSRPLEATTPPPAPSPAAQASVLPAKAPQEANPVAKESTGNVGHGTGFPDEDMEDIHFDD